MEIEEAFDDDNEDSDHELNAENTGSTSDFEEKTWATDFTLVVEGKRLHVTKVVLGLVSPVFASMFQSDFKESSSNEMELPGKSYTDVLEFLRCIYPNTHTRVNSENVLKILPLAEEYQVTQLKTSCEKFLLRSICIPLGATVERLYEILNLACLYNMHGLRKKGIELVSRYQKNQLDKAQTLIKLPAEVMVEILEQIHTRIEEKNEGLASQMQKTLTENETLRTENKILRQMWSVKAKPNLKSAMNWKEETILLIMHKDDFFENYTPVMKTISMWGIPCRITAKVGPRQQYHENILLQRTNTNIKTDSSNWLSVQVESTNGNVICSFVVQCEVINMYGHAASLSSSHTENLTSSHRSFCTDMFEMSNIENSHFNYKKLKCVYQE